MTIGRKHIQHTLAGLGTGFSRTVFRAGVLSVILLSSFSVFASPPSVPTPSISPFPDTEATTNVVFSAGKDDGRIFRLSIQLDATASNNVVVAFGRDANENGVLDRTEGDLLVGWDAGRWFCHDRVSGFGHSVVREHCPRYLDCNLILNPRKEAKLLTAVDGYGVVFEEAVPSSMFSDGWNMMRVMSRGLDEPDGLIVSDVVGWGLRVIVR